VSNPLGSKAVITGAAGFIGSFLAERLLDEGLYVTGVDDFSRGRPENVEALRRRSGPRFEFIRADLSRGFPLEALRDASVVFHYAAINGTRHFYERPLEVLRINSESTFRTVEAAAEAHSVEGIIFASSSEVYGEPSRVPTGEDEPCQVLDTANPRHSYSLSKMAGESYVISGAKTRGLPYLAFRIFNTYGPRMDTSAYGQVVPEFIRKLLWEPEFSIIGDGTQTRSFCYIDDHVEFTLRAVRSARDCILNLGNPQEITIKDLARRLHVVAGRPFAYRPLPAREGDVLRRVPATRRIESITGYRPRVSLDDGLRGALDWYSERPAPGELDFGRSRDSPPAPVTASVGGIT
jgi:nucleoside-diphosphate-sugar epimerase